MKGFFVFQEVHVYRIAYHVVLVVGDKQELIVPFQVLHLWFELRGLGFAGLGLLRV